MPNYFSNISSSQKWGQPNGKYDITYTFDDVFNINAFKNQLSIAGATITGDGNAVGWDAAIAAIEKVTAVDFKPTAASSAQIALLTAKITSNYEGFGFRNPTDQPVVTRGLGIVKSTVDPTVYIHELLHGLGLDHPGHGVGTFPGYTKDTTIMSYNVGAVGGGRVNSSPMVYDIAVLQQKYGVNTATNSATITLDGTTKMHTIWDAGGVDTLDATKVQGVTKIDLRGMDAAGKFIYSSAKSEIFTFALDPVSNWKKSIVVEHVKGSTFWENTLTGNEAGNSLTGGNANDTLCGGLGNDTLLGGGGNDMFLFNFQASGVDTVADFNAASAAEKLDLSAFGISSHQLSALSVQVGADTEIRVDGDYKIILKNTAKAAMLDNVTGLVGGTKGNYLPGNAANNVISHLTPATNGLHPTDHNDTLFGGAGNDALHGRRGSDTYIWRRGDGKDSFIEVLNPADKNTLRLEGISQNDVYLNYGGYGQLILNIRKADGTMETFFIKQAEAFQGSSKADISKGLVFNYIIMDDAAWDLTKGMRLRSSDAFDNVKGLEGLTADDTLEGGRGMSGMEGNDTYIVSAYGASVDISDFFGNNRIVFQGAGDFKIRDTAADRVYTFTDTGKSVRIFGYNLHASQWDVDASAMSSFWTATGTANNDIISGTAGNDRMLGLGGNDVLNGVSGNDTLEGGAGLDQLTGGAGVDRFKFYSKTESIAGRMDRIMDFVEDTDKIDLAGIGFKGITSGVPGVGQLKVAYDSASNQTFVKDISGGSDFAFSLNGNHAGLDAADFLFA